MKTKIIPQIQFKMEGKLDLILDDTKNYSGEDLANYLINYILQDDKTSNELFKPLAYLMGVKMDQIDYMGVDEILIELPKQLEELKNTRKNIRKILGKKN
tara:strand:+ start:3563 stop:3862 length:300 start_codon:yes stop_codon:yes gene_type:complete